MSRHFQALAILLAALALPAHAGAAACPRLSGQEAMLAELFADGSDGRAFILLPAMVGWDAESAPASAGYAFCSEPIPAIGSVPIALLLAGPREPAIFPMPWGDSAKPEVEWTPAKPVPEPATWMMLIAGVAMVGWRARRRAAPRGA